jgi:hypothetical protein
MNNETIKSGKVDTTSDYVEYTNHEGFPFRVINFDNPKYAPNEGIVELYPIKVAKGVQGQAGIPYRHKADVSFTVCTDKVGRFYVGIPSKFNRTTGDMEFQKLKFNDVEILDLSVEFQRKKFIVFKYSTFFVESPNFAPSIKTTYGLTDKQKETDMFFANRKTKRKASEIADSLVGEALEETALALGIDPKMYSPSALSKAVIEYAEDERRIDGKTGAQRFLEAYDNDHKAELIILKRGLNVGVLDETPNGGISYNGITLGYSEDEAIKYLKGHAATAVSIDTQSRTKHGASNYSLPTHDTVKDEKDAEIARLKRELQETREKEARAREAALEASSTNSVADENPELAEVLSTWTGKIKGIHLIGRGKSPEERLQLINKKVEEYKATLKN